VSPERPFPASRPPPGAPATDLPEPAAPPAPADADDTRGRHFRRLLNHTATIVLGGIAVVGGFIAVSLVATPVIGAAVAAGALALVLLIVFLLANSAAREDFFRAYAKSRSLRRMGERARVAPLTPLLEKGDERYTEERFDGVLPGGVEGSLGLYTYEEESVDSKGNQQTTYVHFTIAITDLPATAAFIRELFCQRRVGFRFMDSAEDVFRRRRRVEHESEDVDRRFEIFTGADDDLNRARQVLSPRFLVWLDDHAPEGFAFELAAGSLVCNVKGHKKSAAELDALCHASAAVARRLDEEASEPGSPVG